jgi:ribosomal protein S18 acetylase RimI-like enzyme
MDENVLDNPIWASLRSRHRDFAMGSHALLRYPAPVAPFLGIARAETGVDADLAQWLGSEETVYLLGFAPRLSAAWSCKAYPDLAQMICTDPIPELDGPDVLALSDAHRDDVLALTALVYPHYFRERTMDLGRYFGMYVDGRLAAIIGERMATDDYQEISAVCTHPDFLGRGYARRLLAMLSNDVLERGRIPFLHVSHENRRAKELYLQTGYRLRRDIGFWSLRRAA